jgi:hypothetical protein
MSTEEPAQASAHLTRHVAEFICAAKTSDLPADVMELGRKSLLDGLGLAISGNATEIGELVRRHLADLHLGAGPSTIIGTKLKIAPTHRLVHGRDPECRECFHCGRVGARQATHHDAEFLIHVRSINTRSRRGKTRRALPSKILRRLVSANPWCASMQRYVSSK